MDNSIEDCRSWKDWTYGQFYASALIIGERGDGTAANRLTEPHYNIIEFCLPSPFLLIELAWLNDQDSTEVKTSDKTGSPGR